MTEARDAFDAMCAMRNSINEFIPMPSLESDLLQGPEVSVLCATVAEAVIAEVRRLRLALEPSAIRHSFDGHGWGYVDAGSGSDWIERGMSYPDAEMLYEKGAPE